MICQIKLKSKVFLQKKVSLLNCNHCNYLDQVTVKHTVYLLQSVVGVFSPGAASFF